MLHHRCALVTLLASLAQGMKHFFSSIVFRRVVSPHIMVALFASCALHAFFTMCWSPFCISFYLSTLKGVACCCSSSVSAIRWYWQLSTFWTKFVPFTVNTSKVTVTTWAMKDLLFKKCTRTQLILVETGTPELILTVQPAAQNNLWQTGMFIKVIPSPGTADMFTHLSQKTN